MKVRHFVLLLMAAMLIGTTAVVPVQARKIESLRKIGSWRVSGGQGADVGGSSIALMQDQPGPGQNAVAMRYDMGTHVNYNYVVFGRLLRKRISLTGKYITMEFKSLPDTQEPGVQLQLTFVDLAGNGREKGAYSCTFSRNGRDHRIGRWVKLLLPLSRFAVRGHPNVNKINLIQFQATVYRPADKRSDKGCFYVSQLRVEPSLAAKRRKEK